MLLFALVAAGISITGGEGTREKDIALPIYRRGSYKNAFRLVRPAEGQIPKHNDVKEDKKKCQRF
jgi:hypothetical protein